ncbi:MAG: MarR family transcriptional regulator [Burkholderiaceae bacterium]|nr:MarR family transcriptional regulator [Burkholderiaceae bacterium]MDZ4146381.1 MarR family transcriptional regulator [Burkholderiales bacterium]
MPKPTLAKSADLCDAPDSLMQAAADDAAQVLRQFRIVFNAVRHHFRRVENASGLGGAQIWALGLVAASPGLRVNALAVAMDIHQSTASNLLRGLTERGLLRAERETTDRRSVKLHLTDTGQAALGRAPGPYAGVLPDALAQLDPATLMQLSAGLGQLIATLQADEAAGRLPLAQL